MINGVFVKARSHDLIFGSKNWKQAFRLQDSVFVVRKSEGHLQCVHTIRFAELTKNLQFGAKMIMQNLSVPFIFQGEGRMKIEHVLFPSVFFKITDHFDGRSFLTCSHDPFFGINKNRILKNGSCELAFSYITD